VHTDIYFSYANINLSKRGIYATKYFHSVIFDCDLNKISASSRDLHFLSDPNLNSVTSS